MTVAVLRGDARSLPLPDACVDLIVTSPPYFGLRSYTDGGEHYDGQIGSEATPGEYVAALVGCTREWVRVLKPSGSMFVNLGDKYSGYYGPNWKHDRNPGGGERQPRGYRDDLPVSAPTAWGVANKSLMGLPWRYALAATDQLGLILRAEIIWSKPNGLPESVTDRVRRAHEQVFHFTVRPRYYSAVDEIREPSEIVFTASQNGTAHHRRAMAAAEGHHRYDVRTNNPLGKLPGSVWDIPSQPLTVPPALGIDHFAAFPMELPRRIIAGWSPPGVCTECGEGRRPVVETPTAFGHVNECNNDGHIAARGGVGATSQLRLSGGPLQRWREKNPARLLGYACACPQPDASTRPAIILDPFGGTGTTALLASALGRHGITIDRSADYCRIAAWRTSDRGELARALEVPKPPPTPENMDALF